MIFMDRQGEEAWTVSDSLSGTDYVRRLENRLERATGKSVVALCSADAAIHTALHLCGVKRGDHVFVPSYTFYSNIATVANIGALPVFLDCEPSTRCVSAAALETALLWAELQGKPPKAVIVDNAFGAVADYAALLPMCKAHGVPMIELAGDAFGGTFGDVPCGANGDYGILNFSKRVAGGGGAIVCGREDAGEARAFARVVYSDGENHDYKMHNVIAALDCGRLPAAARMAARAKANLAALSAAVECVLPPTPGDAAAYALCREGGVAGVLRAQGYTVIQPPPAHTLSRYSMRPFFEHEQGFNVCAGYASGCLISMDISAFSVRRLMRILRAII